MGSFNYRDIDVFLGVDMAKQDHYAQVILGYGTEVFDRSVVNDEAAINGPCRCLFVREHDAESDAFR